MLAKDSRIFSNNASYGSIEIVGQADSVDTIEL